MGGEKFLVGLRGLKFFGRVSDRFSGPFSRVSNRFSCQIKNFSGAVSFCRRAALMLLSGQEKGVITQGAFSLEEPL